MCTWIQQRATIRGSGKGPNGWFALTDANVGYDHPFHAPFGHAVLLDFPNPRLGIGARVALEMDIASAKALLATLSQTIQAAEQSGLAE